MYCARDRAKYTLKRIVKIAVRQQCSTFNNGILLRLEYIDSHTDLYAE